MQSGSWSHFTYFLSFRHAAVGDLNADKIVVQVVVYPRHTTPRIQNYEKKGLVPKKRSSNISHFCKQLHFCHLKPSKETLLTFILMATRFPAASYVNVRAFCADKGDDRDARMVHDVKYGIMLFIRIIAFLIIY